VGDQTSNDLAKWVEPIFERRRDAKIATAAPERPKEIGLGLFCDVEHRAVCGYELNGEQIVGGEAVAAQQPAEAPAECEARNPGRRDRAAGDGEPMHSRLSVELRPEDASLCTHRPCLWVDVRALHLGEIDHQAAIGDAAPGNVVSTTPDRDLQTRLARESHRSADVCDAAAPCDQRGPLVDEPIVDEAGGFVAVVAGLEHGA